MSFKTTVYGKYFLLDRIATGGMAEVFKAKTFGVRGFERLLVIKRILPHLSKDEDFVEMFIDEAKIAVELTHANICQVNDLGKIADNYFIAMEYIDGKDLRAILKKATATKAHLPVPMAMYVAMEVLEGLDYAHRKTDSLKGELFHLIHRDISPQNIMVSYHGDVKIVDFGIAKTAFKLNQTQAGVLKGKFGYMSPEQAAGLELDARTDLFSAGIILYEMLTGRRLFLGENDFETLEKIKECNVPRPSKYNAEITEELEKVILRMLAKEREDRYATAQDIHTDLSKIFYTQYAGFSPRELSTFMGDIFSQEIAEEQEALRRAVDSMPAKAVEAATNAAEQDGDRIVDSSGPHSRTRPPPRPIGASIAEETGTSSFRALMKLIRLAVILTVPALLLLLIWKWPDLKETKPKGPKPKPTVMAEQVPVEMTSRPEGATLFVNGQAKGITPVRLDLPAKRHFIRFEKEGYVPFEKEILITTTDTAFGPYTLEKATPPIGVLEIVSQPARAIIFFDDKSTGLRTPATLREVTLNEPHNIRVELDGFKPEKRDLTMVAEEDRLSFDLEPDSVTLRLDIAPPDASVYLDGKLRGHEILNLKVGKSYSLKVTAKGYITHTQKFRPEEPREVLVLNLKKMQTKYGTVTLFARPWSKIYIDEKLVGTGEPLLDHKLPVGKHTIEFKNPNCQSVKKEINIVPGPNQAINFELEKCR